MRLPGRGISFLHLALFIIILLISPVPSLHAKKITLNDFIIDVKKEAVESRHDELKEKSENKEKKWLVQFTGPVHAAEKKQLLDLGCRIQDYVPEFAFIVTMDEQTRKEVAELPFIQGVARYRPEHKIRKSLKEKISKDREQNALLKKADREDKQRIHIRVDSAEHLSLALSLVHRYKGKVLEIGHDVATVQIPAGAIDQLAELEEVLWFEEALELKLLNDTSSWTIQTYFENETKIWDHGILGQRQIIGVADTGLDYDMPWFRDPDNAPIGPQHRKVIGYSAYTDDYDGDFGHGTHVAGTLAGDRSPVDGLSNAGGMAPGAKLFIQDIAPGEERAVYPPSDLGLLFIAPYTAGARLHSNSWGAAQNVYNTYARTADRFLWEHKDFLAFFANGNTGAVEGSVGTPATAKNVVSVGAAWNGDFAEDLAAFSSRGPTADGRIKPTVTAPGLAIVSADSDGIKGSYNNGTIALSGTSMATPTTAGAAALVRQYYLDGYWPLGSPNAAHGFAPSGALIKATLINSAQNMTGDYTGGPAPSNGQGWGRINLANTLHFTMDDNFLDIADIPTGLSTGSTWSRRYFSTGGQVLKVTLVWTDYPGMEGAAKDLVNDLHLLVTTPEGITYRGNVFDDGFSSTGGSADALNVVEQVVIPTSGSGDYRVSVSGYNVPFGPQPFAVVVTGAVSISSAGFMYLDKSRYNHEDTILIQVVDRDLNTGSSRADEVYIYIESTSEPGGETVRLVENDLNSSIFIGSIPTGAGPEIAHNGYLEVAEGDAITALYFDADDGTGSPATVTAAALADLTPPVIADIAVDSAGQDFAAISWTTDEPVSAAVSYGETPDALGTFPAEAWLMTSPVVRIGSLKENTTYYYMVSCTDEAGNIRRDDNTGHLYSFTTLSLPPDLTFYSSNLTDTYATGTVLYGTALDPSGIESIRIAGGSCDEAVPCRPGDGYYELTVPLAIGENLFTVTATDSLGNYQTRELTVIRRQQPDLTVTSVIAPEKGGFFQPIHIENTICNNGPGVSPGTGTISWYLSQDPDISPAEDTRLGLNYWYQNDILPGACVSVPVDIRLSIPLDLVWHTYYLAACVDRLGEIWEADETNNIRLAGSRITIEGADLEMSALSGPVYIESGDDITVFNSVRNIGLGTSLSFNVGIYLSPDTVITMDDIKIGGRYVNMLEPVGSPYPYPSESSQDMEILVGSAVPEGTYYIGAIAAPGSTFYEPDKENNMLVGNLVQVTKPKCMSDADCDDNLFCNGIETCAADGACRAGTPVACADDGLFCSGSEVCIESIRGCGSTGNPCSDGAACDEARDQCGSMCGNGACDPAEDCSTCPDDCLADSGNRTCTPGSAARAVIMGPVMLLLRN
ncbi:MAG: S8 family serine peptidase [Desulfobulbaceae bacterium]|nr:S8 family serine peptidase [Desulfobulbaceae bacterium]